MTYSPKSSIGCVYDDFRAYGKFSTNRASILHQDQHYLQMDSYELPLEPRHLGVPSDASKMIFRANGMFSANCAPILYQD
jgi:hypothetical protein